MNCRDDDFWDHSICTRTFTCEYCGEQADVIVQTSISCREPVFMAPTSEVCSLPA